MVMTEDEKKMTAYHEAGHAIVGMSVPEHDRFTRSPSSRVAVPWVSRSSCLSRTATVSRAGGSRVPSPRCSAARIAEELIFGQDAVTTVPPTTSERATELARNMVTKWACRTSSDL